MRYVADNRETYSCSLFRKRGGTIVIQSRLGQGATFFIKFPMSRDTDSSTGGKAFTMID